MFSSSNKQINCSPHLVKDNKLNLSWLTNEMEQSELRGSQRGFLFTEWIWRVLSSSFNNDFTDKGQNWKEKAQFKLQSTDHKKRTFLSQTVLNMSKSSSSPDIWICFPLKHGMNHKWAHSADCPFL